jgi:hypothetical protein
MVIWECLNAVYYTDEVGMKEHRRLLMLYRRRLAKAKGIDPKDIECSLIEDYYEFLKGVQKRRLGKAAA